jgi:hypothetical protein
MMLQIDIHRWFAMTTILNPKWPSKYKNPPIWAKFGFQVDYDVVDIPTQFHELDERNTFFLNPPFLFPWQLRQSWSIDSDFVSLSRSTRCEGCSYQASSISVWRVTCYDHFCVFQFGRLHNR